MKRPIEIITPPSIDESIKTYIKYINDLRRVTKMSDNEIYLFVKSELEMVAKLLPGGTIDRALLNAIQNELNIKESVIDRIRLYMGIPSKR